MTEQAKKLTGTPAGPSTLYFSDTPTSGASFTVPYHSAVFWSPLLNTHHLKTEFPPLEVIPLSLTVRSCLEKPAKKLTAPLTVNTTC